MGLIAPQHITASMVAFSIQRSSVFVHFISISFIVPCLLIVVIKS